MEARALLEKYVELLALRRVRRDAPEAPPPLPRLRALAARFPGALRELERLPMDLLEERARELEGVVAGLVEEPRWARAQRLYHAGLTRALAARAAGPQGRTREPGSMSRPGLTARVVEVVALELGVTSARCRSLLFPWTPGSSGRRGAQVEGLDVVEGAAAGAGAGAAAGAAGAGAAGAGAALSAGALASPFAASLAALGLLDE